MHTDLDKDICVLATSNCPWTSSNGVIQGYVQFNYTVSLIKVWNIWRFEKKIYIALPDLKARQKLFGMKICSAPHELTEQDFRDLAKRTEGYSGADITAVVKGASMHSLHRITTATHFKKVNLKKESYYMCALFETECTC